jgi:hypothetical protein
MTDFRELCAELVAWVDKASAHYYQSPELLIRARAALAEPQPAADGEVVATGKPGLHVEPIPVSERLPEAGDCDEQGRCWWWYAPVPEQTYGYWLHEDNATERALDEWPTHWLPAHALPLPSREVE